MLFSLAYPFVLYVLVLAISFAMITSWWEQMGSTLKVSGGTWTKIIGGPN